MYVLAWFLLGFGAFPVGRSLRYDPQQVDHNLNTNQQALSPLDYSGEWQNHTFTPSPDNWRVPFYTIILDRFANGNPTNDDANGTQFELDPTQTTLRHGGDIQGLQDSLDYLQGMGIRVGQSTWDLAFADKSRSSTSLAVLSSMHLGQLMATVHWI